MIFKSNSILKATYFNLMNLNIYHLSVLTEHLGIAESSWFMVTPPHFRLMPSIPTLNPPTPNPTFVVASTFTTISFPSKRAVSFFAILSSTIWFLTCVCTFKLVAFFGACLNPTTFPDPRLVSSSPFPALTSTSASA